MQEAFFFSRVRGGRIQLNPGCSSVSTAGLVGGCDKTVGTGSQSSLALPKEWWCGSFFKEMGPWARVLKPGAWIQIQPWGLRVGEENVGEIGDFWGLLAPQPRRRA